MVQDNLPAAASHGHEVRRVIPSLAAGTSPGGWWPSTIAAPTRKRASMAFAIAALSDVLSFVFIIAPPAQLAVDILTAIALWLLLGARWPLLPALIAEAIPILQLFPTWTMVAGAYWWYSRANDRANGHQCQEVGELHGVENDVHRDRSQH